MNLSEGQRKQLGNYLSNQNKICKCGSNDWEFGETQLPIAGIDLGNRKIDPSRMFVDITCRSCGDSEAIDCERAGISET